MKFLDFNGLGWFLTKLKTLFVSKEELDEHVSDFQTKLDLKVDTNQGIDNAGKVLTVDAAGVVTPSYQEQLTLVYHEDSRTLEFVADASPSTSTIPNSTLAYSYDGYGTLTVVSEGSTSDDDEDGNATIDLSSNVIVTDDGDGNVTLSN